MNDFLARLANSLAGGRLHAAEARVRALEQALQQTQIAYDQASAAQDKQREKIDRLIEHRETLKQDLRRTGADLDASRAAEKALAEAERQLREAHRRLEQDRAEEAEALDARNLVLSQALEALAVDRDTREAALTELARAHTELQAAHAVLETEHDGLRAELTATTKERGALQAEHEGLRRKLEMVLERREALKSELTAVRAAATEVEAAFKAELETLNAERETERSRAFVAEKARLRAEAAARERVRDIDNLTEDLKQVGAELQEARAHWAKKEDERLQLQNALQQQRARADEAENTQHRVFEKLEQERERSADFERQKRDAEQKWAQMVESAARAQEAHNHLAAAAELIKQSLETERAMNASLRLASTDLTHHQQRFAVAAAEERAHFALAQALDLLHPREEAPEAELSSEEAAREAARTVDAAKAAGALVYSRRAPWTNDRAVVSSPRTLTTAITERRPSWVLLTDDDDVVRKKVAAADPKLRVLSLFEANVARAAGITDPGQPPSPLREFKKALLIVSQDARGAAAAAEAIARIAGVRALPSIPAQLEPSLRAGRFTAAHWLQSAWLAAGTPPVFSFCMNKTVAEAMARETRAGENKFLMKVHHAARVMHLVWANKARQLAADIRLRTGVLDKFDDGDARMSMPAYQRIAYEDRALAALLESGQVGLVNEIVKGYRELTNTPALAQFCRDAGLSVRPAQFEGALSVPFGPPDGSDIDGAAAAIARSAEASLAAQTDANSRTTTANRLAEALERAGRFDEARDVYAKAAEDDPQDVNARLGAARYAELAGDPAAAEQWLRKGMKHDRQNALLLALVDLYERTGQTKQGVAAARLLRRRGDRRAPSISVRQAYNARRFAEIRRLFDKYPDDVAGVADLVSIAVEEAELESLQAAASSGNTDAGAHIALAEASRLIGREKEALPRYLRALKADRAAALASFGIETPGPDFIVAGAPRTATTLLRRLIDLHPDTGFAPGEPTFFTAKRDANLNATPVRLPDYFKVLADVRASKPAARIVGEKTPQYFAMPDTSIALAAALFPAAKIIITTRDPIDRAWSEIKQVSARRVADASIIATFAPAVPPAWLTAIIENGRYLAHLRRWRAHFAANQVLLVSSENLERDVAGEMARIFTWLGVDPARATAVETMQRNWNNRTPRHPLPKALEVYLRKAYAGEIWKVEELDKALAAAPAT